MFTALRRFGIAAFAVSLLPVLALADPGPAPRSERPWTDPPARGSGEAKADSTASAPKSSEVPRMAAAPVAPATRRAPRSVKAPSMRTAPPVKLASRPVVSRRSFAPAAPHARMAAPAPAFRVVTMRPLPRAAPPFARYGYVVEPVPVRLLSYDDPRIARIRSAGADGYVVVRSRSVEFPDGRRLRTYRPADDDIDD